MSKAMYDSEEDATLVDKDDIADFNLYNVLPLSSEELVTIKKWLQPTPYDLEKGEFRRHLSSHLQGTGSWLTSTDVYRQWHEGSENGILWIKGIPGSGKSVIAASLIDQLTKDGSPVVYFFFRQIIEANHKPAAALRDWLHQLLHRSPPLQTRLKDYAERKRDIESLSMSDLWKDIKFVLGSFPKVYCVVDALDEMDQGNDDFMLELAGLGRWRPSNVKVLITSRPITTIENTLRSASIPQIRLDEVMVDRDITTYVQNCLEKSSIPHDFHADIKEAVPGRANGLFLYAKLVMDAFTEPGGDARKILKDLPSDLNIMYNRLLRENAMRSQVPADIQLLVLQFVTHATRPLRLLEIAEMLCKSFYRDQGEHHLKEIKDLVRAACGSLIEILPDETISVVHHSFTEYLKGYTRSTEHLSSDVDEFVVLLPGPTNREIAKTCLAYLESGCLDNLKLKIRPEERTAVQGEDPARIALRLEHPFLEYSARNWHVHVRRAAFAGAEMIPIYRKLDRFFESEKRTRVLLDIDWQEMRSQNATPLHIAAGTGLPQYVAHLLSQKRFDVNANDSHQKTSLFWAASSGYADVVQLLLDEGALPNEDDHVGFRPLHAAARNNHGDVIRVLLRAGVDPLTRKTKGRFCGDVPRPVGQTPLMYACENGHLDALSAFLEIIQDVGIVQRALFWASRKGHSILVTRILQYPGIDVNSKYMGDTVLFVACQSRDEKTIEALTNAGADPNILCKNSADEFSEIGSAGYLGESGPNSEKESRPIKDFTALHSLCGLARSYQYLDYLHCKVSQRSIQLLLQAGASVNQQAPDGKIALHYASQNAHEIIASLVTAGADPTVADNQGNTPLHILNTTNKDVLSALFGRNVVDINKQRTSDGKTPLICWLQNPRTQSDDSILSYGPDIHATDFEGNGPLHTILGMDNSNPKILQSLLTAGANPNLKNRKGETPLHVLRKGAPDIIDALLKAGADLEIRDNNGRNVLFQAINNTQSHSEEIIQTVKNFVARGSRLDARDFNGRTMLHEAIHISQEISSGLVNLGCDPGLTDYEGNTLYHEMIMTEMIPYKESYALWTDNIRKWGLDTDKANHHGRNSIHLACTRTRRKEVHELKMPRIEFALSLCKDIDHADNEGIRPLHLAATISEFYVHRLLAAGADILASTNEGMTALHLSARARQANVVGLILEECTKADSELRVKFLNQQDDSGQTALHYACRSGRPETVKLLLRAGANPNVQDKLERSPLQACAEFDREINLWEKSYEQNRDLYAAGTRIDDNARPFHKFSPDGRHIPTARLTHRAPPEPSNIIIGKIIEVEHDTVRLDEILDLLVKHGAEIDGDESPLIQAIITASLNHSEYCLAKLLKVHSHTNQESLIKSYGKNNMAILDCKYRAEARRSAITDSYEFKCALLKDAHDFFSMLLLRKEYDILRDLVKEGFDVQQLTYHGVSVIHCLSRWGYANVLEQFCTPEAAKDFDSLEWCNLMEQDGKGRCADASIMSPLLIACERTLPNMEVIRTLVEQLNVNLDTQRRHRDHLNVVTYGGCLHGLALGKHWWHVGQALPYFIQKGANLEMRDLDGATPLHKALCSKYPYARVAAELVMIAGADTNAAKNDGSTCLAMAGNDTETVKLLVLHGAKVTALAIFSAIDRRKPEILEVLLAQGNYANLRRERTEESDIRGCYAAEQYVDDAEIYPLQHAASLIKGFERSSLEIATQERLVKILLEKGADLYAEFFMRVPDFDDENYEDDLDAWFAEEEPHMPSLKWKTESHTVGHDLLRSNSSILPLLDVQCLDVERRDASGSTFLLAICQEPGDMGPLSDTRGLDKRRVMFQKLCERGADMNVCDQKGRNILHHLSQLQVCDFLKYAVSRAPNLLKQADHEGNTPFHYSLELNHLPVVEFYIENGANLLQQDSEGNTALHYLTSKSDGLSPDVKDVFLKCLEAGILINSQNHQGETPLWAFMKHRLARWCHYVKNQENRGFRESMLIVMEYFRDAWADISARNYAGSTLLHLLASLEEANVVRFAKYDEMEVNEVVMWFKYLMSLGLDPMAEDNSQRTTLDVAAAHGNEQILKIFEKDALTA